MHFNTELVFDKHGALIAKYYKIHTYGEPEYDRYLINCCEILKQKKTCVFLTCFSSLCIVWFLFFCVCVLCVLWFFDCLISHSDFLATEATTFDLYTNEGAIVTFAIMTCYDSMYATPSIWALRGNIRNIRGFFWHFFFAFF